MRDLAVVAIAIFGALIVIFLGLGNGPLHATVYAVGATWGIELVIVAVVFLALITSDTINGLKPKPDRKTGPRK